MTHSWCQSVDFSHVHRSKFDQEFAPENTSVLVVKTKHQRACKDNRGLMYEGTLLLGQEKISAKKRFLLMWSNMVKDRLLAMKLLKFYHYIPFGLQCLLSIVRSGICSFYSIWHQTSGNQQSRYSLWLLIGPNQETICLVPCTQRSFEHMFFELPGKPLYKLKEASEAGCDTA